MLPRHIRLPSWVGGSTVTCYPLWEVAYIAFDHYSHQRDKPQSQYTIIAISEFQKPSLSKSDQVNNVSCENEFYLHENEKSFPWLTDLTSLWNRGPLELGNGLLVLSHTIENTANQKARNPFHTLWFYYQRAALRKREAARRQHNKAVAKVPRRNESRSDAT